MRSPDASASSSSACELGTTSVATAVVAIGPGTIAAAASSTIAHRSSTVPPAPPDSSGKRHAEDAQLGQARVRRPPGVGIALLDVAGGR